MKKQVLTYNIESEKISALRQELKGLGCAVREVSPKEYGVLLGALAGLDGYVYKKNAKPEGNVGSGFAVICGFSGVGIDAVLAAFRRSKLGGEVLKAVLTDTNARWNSVELYNEVKREHEYMTKR